MKNDKKPLLSSLPPKSPQRTVEEFIAGAEEPMRLTTTVVNKVSKDLPWENPYIRDDLTRVFNLRLTEKDFVKLEYLSKIKKESMQKICKDILLPEINHQLNID